MSRVLFSLIFLVGCGSGSDGDRQTVEPRGALQAEKTVDGHGALVSERSLTYFQGEKYLDEFVAGREEKVVATESGQAYLAEFYERELEPSVRLSQVFIAYDQQGNQLERTEERTTFFEGRQDLPEKHVEEMETPGLGTRIAMTDYEYNDTLQLTRTVEAVDHIPTSRVNFSYDARGRLVRKETLDGDGSLVEEINFDWANLQQEEFRYNEVEKVTYHRKTSYTQLAGKIMTKTFSETVVDGGMRIEVSCNKSAHCQASASDSRDGEPFWDETYQEIWVDGKAVPEKASVDKTWFTKGQKVLRMSLERKLNDEKNLVKEQRDLTILQKDQVASLALNEELEEWTLEVEYLRDGVHPKQQKKTYKAADKSKDRISEFVYYE